MDPKKSFAIVLASVLLALVACSPEAQELGTTATTLPDIVSTVDASSSNNDASTDDAISTSEPTVESTNGQGDELLVDDPGSEAGGFEDLVEMLRESGAAVELVGGISQPFLSVDGQVITIEGMEVQVFEYPDAEAANVDAALISPDASSVGTSMVTWLASPHFYAKDRLIALYVGDDEAVIESLNGVMGQPVAEGMMDPYQEPDAVTALAEALAVGDYDALEGLMGETFIIGYWLSEGVILTPAEAIDQLRLSLLPDPGAVNFIRDREQFPDLGGIDPTAAFGPDVRIVDLVYSQGWGGDGLGDVILTIAESDDGRQYWHGMVYGPAGFSAFPLQPPPEQTLSFEAATYQNEDNNFEFDYPAAWSFEEEIYGPRGAGAQFFSGDEFALSSVVYLWDPKNDLDAYIDHLRDGWLASGLTILSEEELTLAGDWRAVLMNLGLVEGGKNLILFAEVGDRYLQLSGSDDPGLVAEIIQTLRPIDSGS